jgi:Outer membrane protein beta-barrel domain
MKKINSFILFAFLFSGLNLNAAKLFVGGGLSLNSNSSSITSGTTTLNGDSKLSWNFAPEVGYYLSDNLAIGLSLGIGSSSITSPISATANKVTSSSTWAVSPFARYSIAKTGNFSFFGEGNLTIGGGSSQVTSGSTTLQGPATSTFGIGVQPGISYDLSDKVSLIAKMGGVSYSNAGTSVTSGTGTAAVTTTTSSPNLDFGLGLNNLSFGAIVKF